MDSYTRLTADSRALRRNLYLHPSSRLAHQGRSNLGSTFSTTAEIVFLPFKSVPKQFWYNRHGSFRGLRFCLKAAGFAESCASSHPHKHNHNFCTPTRRQINVRHTLLQNSIRWTSLRALVGLASSFFVAF